MALAKSRCTKRICAKIIKHLHKLGKSNTFAGISKHIWHLSGKIARISSKGRGAIN